VPPRLRLPTAVVAALVVAEAAVLLLRPKERYPVVPTDPRAYFSAAELERAVDFRTGQLWLYGARTLVELGVLLAAVRLAPKGGRHPVLTGAATAVAITLTATTAALPLRAASRQRAKNVGLITQSWGGWAGDVVKSAAIASVFAAGGGALVAFGIRRFGRDWWAPGAALVAGFAVVFTYLGPIALDPVFNTFTPLPAGQTRSDILDLARRADVDEVTLLKDFTPAETRLVIAHELGHVHYKDVPHGLLWLALVAPFGTFAVARAGEKLTRSGATPVPAVLLAFAVTAPVFTTISNQLSRAIERRADAFALELTHEPGAMVDFERRITIQNVGDPDPPRWQRVVFGTHPSTMERIGQALAARS
jgi:STE24 endopeptidase